MNIDVRSIVYGITMLCSKEKTKRIDVHRLCEMTNLDRYRYAEIFMLLERQKLIEAIKCTDPLEGYETPDGDFHLINNNYLFKTFQGIWRLKKRGKLIVVICDMFKDNSAFYDFIVKRNLEMLKKLEEN